MKMKVMLTCFVCRSWSRLSIDLLLKLRLLHKSKMLILDSNTYLIRPLTSESMLTGS